jgi:hypothetical protein
MNERMPIKNLDLHQDLCAKTVHVSSPSGSNTWVASKYTSISVPHALRHTSTESGQVPAVRHESHCRGHSIRVVATHVWQPVAHCRDGRSHDCDHGCRDDDALIGPAPWTLAVTNQRRPVRPPANDISSYPHAELCYGSWSCGNAASWGQHQWIGSTCSA